jgi:hypothetical protein
MAARDPYYDLVRNALRQEGWRITHNPLRLRLPTYGTQTSQDEAAAEPLLAAEKDERRIAIVVKSLVGHSSMEDLQKVWQLLRLCHMGLRTTEPDYALYLAVRQTTYREYFVGPAGAQLLARQPLLFIVFDPRTETIVNWNGRASMQ